MKFTKEQLLDKLDGEAEEDTIVETSRWSVLHDLIFRHEGNFYQTTYSCGATEQQDEAPFEYNDPETECPLVVQVPETVMVWKAMK